MAAILTIAGWAFLLGLLGLTALLVARLFADDGGPGELRATAALLALCGAVCAAGVLGLIPAIAAIVSGVVIAVTVVVLCWEMARKVKDPHPVAKVLGGLALVSRLAVREALQAARGHKPRDDLADRRNAKAAAASPSPAPAVRAAPAPRPAPPPRKAPALAATPLPRAVAQGRVSQAWAQVISGIRDFEPESDADFLEHWQVQASGLVGVADAMLDQADTLGEDGLGLAPAIVGAVMDGADAASETSERFSGIREWLLRVYSGSREDAANGHPLPKDGRWVTGEDAG